MADIAMAHPNVPGEIAHASQAAFDQVWKRKGWEITEEPDADALAEAALKDEKPEAESKAGKPEKLSPKDNSSQGEVGNDG